MPLTFPYLEKTSLSSDSVQLVGRPPTNTFFLPFSAFLPPWNRHTATTSPQVCPQAPTACMTKYILFYILKKHTPTYINLLDSCTLTINVSANQWKWYCLSESLIRHLNTNSQCYHISSTCKYIGMGFLLYLCHLAIPIIHIAVFCF